MYLGRDPNVPRQGRVLQIEGLEDVIEQGSVVDGVAEVIYVEDNYDANNEDNNNENEEHKSNSENENDDNNEDSTATGSDTILQSPRITTRGKIPRTMRPARHADGTEIRNYGLAALLGEQEEIIKQAITIKDKY
jgi:hypothetical protein